MIQLTKLDGNFILLNIDNVKFIEANADTIVHHINGDTLIIKESMEEVEKLVVDYQKKVLGQ